MKQLSDYARLRFTCSLDLISVWQMGHLVKGWGVTFMSLLPHTSHAQMCLQGLNKMLLGADRQIEHSNAAGGDGSMSCSLGDRLRLGVGL